MQQDQVARVAMRHYLSIHISMCRQQHKQQRMRFLCIGMSIENKSYNSDCSHGQSAIALWLVLVDCDLYCILAWV